jgi:hypothetical protein
MADEATASTVSREMSLSVITVLPGAAEGNGQRRSR